MVRPMCSSPPSATVWPGVHKDFARLLNRADNKGWKVCVLDVDVDTTTAAGRLVVDVVAAAAQFESKRIGERVSDAHAVRRAQGKRAGQAPILSDEIRQRIYSEHAGGKSLNAIARSLNDEGVPTAKGGKWHPYTISQIIDSVKLDDRAGCCPQRGCDAVAALKNHPLRPPPLTDLTRVARRDHSTWVAVGITRSTRSSLLPSLAAGSTWEYFPLSTDPAPPTPLHYPPSPCGRRR